MKTKTFILLSFTVIILLSWTYISEKNNKADKLKKKPSHSEIKNYLLFDFVYDNEWKKADSLINKGLPKSAIKIVDLIYEKAKAEKNEPQYIKAVLYKMKLTSDFEEEYILKVIEDLNKELKTAENSLKPVLHSVNASIYWTYYTNNRYSFLNRTETVDFKQDDIRTWDLKKIVEQVIHHHQNALKDKEKHKTVNLNTYDLILQAEHNSKKFRPTLYDFLAHRALDFFMSSEADITKPVYKFEIDNPDYFRSSEIFSKLNITSKDPLSLKYYALIILQDLIKFHINDENPQALIDVELKRLKFVKSYSIVKNSDSLYLKALKEQEKRHQLSSYSTDFSFLIAKEYSSYRSKYDPLQSDDHKWDLKTAYKICSAAIEKYPESDGAKNCIILLNHIKTKSFKLTTENVNAPENAFRSLVSYKNVKKLHLRLIKIDPQKHKKLLDKNSGTNLLDKYIEMTPQKEWAVDLIDDGDFQNHKLEIAMPALPYGYYILLAGSNVNYSYTDECVAHSTFWVSNLSFINRQKNKDFYVLDRSTGEAVKDAAVTTFSREYNYTLRKDLYKNPKYMTKFQLLV